MIYIHPSQRREVLVRDPVHKFTVSKFIGTQSQPQSFLNLSYKFLASLFSLSIVWHKAISKGAYVCLSQSLPLSFSMAYLPL